MKQLTVRDYMTPNPYFVRRGSSAAAAAEVMRAHAIRHLPVVDELGQLIGILSERDLRILKGVRGLDPTDVTVDELMTPEPFQLAPGAALTQCAMAMWEQKIGSAVVVENGRVVGVFTTLDAMRALVDLANLLEHPRH